jgi:hypothetical protein
VSNYRNEDHYRQMRNEKPEAVCEVSVTERHVWTIRYDKYGRLVGPENGAGVRRCEACDCAIEQQGARWVRIPEVRLARWQQLPAYSITEEAQIEDVL